MQLSKNIFQPIRVSKNSFVHHLLSYSDVKLGNELEFEVQIKKNGESVPGFESEQRELMSHWINFGIDVQSRNPYLFAFGTGACIVVSPDRSKTTYLSCHYQSEFQTQCVVEGKIKNEDFIPEKHLDVVGDSIVGFSNNPGAQRSSFNWFNTEAKRWDYELYQGLIKDVGHVTVEDGSTWSIIAFKDSVQISKFYENWVYGNRKVHTFSKEDVGTFDFCPEDIVLSSYSMNDAYVFSNCPKDQRVFKFTIKNGAAFLSTSYPISKNHEIESIQVCISFGEITFYNKEKQTLTSYDYGFTTTRVVSNFQSYGIQNPLSFVCVPEANEYWILHSLKVAENDETYLAVFNGGQHKDGLDRIRINKKLEAKVNHLQHFLHRGRITFALFDNDNVLLRSKSFDSKAPLMTTKVTAIPEENQTPLKELSFDLVVKNNRSEARSTNKFIFEEEIKAPSNWIKDGPKEELDATRRDRELTKFKISEAEIEDIKITDGSGGKIAGIDVKAATDDELVFDQNSRQVGKFLRLGKYVLIASYTKDNKMRHGEVKLYSDEKGPNPISAFSTLSSLKSLTAFTYLKEYIIMASLIDNGAANEISVFVAYGGKISSKGVLVQRLNSFDSIDIVFKEEKEVQGLGDTKDRVAVFYIFGYETRQKRLMAYQVSFTLSMSVDAVKQEEWQVQIEKVETNSPIFAGEMAIADHMTTPITNFYFLDRKENTFVSRIQFNKITKTWGKIAPLRIDAENEGESTHLTCQRFNNENDDKCAMSTNGAIIYKALIPSEETNESSISVKDLRRLRISGENYPAKIQLGGDYVLVATKPMRLESAPKILIWDAPNSSADQRLAIPVSQVFELGDGNFADPRSSIFLGSQLYEVDQLGSDSQTPKKQVFEIFYQQQIQGQDKNYYTILVKSKRFNPWTLLLEKNTTSESFSKAVIRIKTVGQDEVAIPLSEAYTFKTAGQNSFQSNSLDESLTQMVEQFII